MELGVHHGARESHPTLQPWASEIILKYEDGFQVDLQNLDWQIIIISWSHPSIPVMSSKVLIKNAQCIQKYSFQRNEI